MLWNIVNVKHNFVTYLLNDFNQVFQHCAAVLFVNNNSSGQISKNMGAHGFNCI